MKRITISLTDDQNERLCREARRREMSLSELIREKLESPTPLPGFVGIADKKLHYDASQVDEELDRTFGRQ